MKNTIKVKILNSNCEPQINKKGDWIDLFAATDIKLKGLESTTLKRKQIDGIKDKFREIRHKYSLIPLGIAMELPKGYEAIVVPRSSTFKSKKCIVTNSIGIIDNSYKGNEDQWYLPILPIENTIIEQGDKICQFRIQLSQFATPWQKFKWFFTNGVKIKIVGDLNSKNRGGFGSTGK